MTGTTEDGLTAIITARAEMDTTEIAAKTLSNLAENPACRIHGKSVETGEHAP